MDLLINVPSWDEVERNLDQKFNELNQGVYDGLQSANDSWNGFTRRASRSATQAYGYIGGDRIDYLRLAIARSYPIIQTNLIRKWASIEIEQILPVLMQLIKEVVMIVGGSVAIGTVAGGVVGSAAFGAGAVPGAMIGSGIGLQVGNLILMALGLAAISEYFCKGLMPCLTTLNEGIATAWNAEEGLKPVGLDPTGGSVAMIDERIERAARQMASGQEQLVLLLLTAIVTYLTRGQIKAGVVSSMESIATRSASLRAGMSNKEMAAWLARNEQKMLANPELRVSEPAPLGKVEPTPTESPNKRPSQEKVSPRAPSVMSLREAVGKDMAERWIRTARANAEARNARLSALLSDDQIGALYGYSTNDVYKGFNHAMRHGTATPEIEAFAFHATEGLSKLPKFPGFETYRGTTLPQDVLDRMQIGAIEVDKAFFSSSATKPFDGNVQMIVRGVSGKDISFLTHLPEAEVLYPPGTAFYVSNRIEQGSITRFLMEEVP